MPRLNLHAHNGFVSGYHFVAYLHEKLEGNIGLLERDHGVVDIGAAPCGQRFDCLVRLMVQFVGLSDGPRKKVAESF